MKNKTEKNGLLQLGQTESYKKITSKNKITKKNNNLNSKEKKYIQATKREIPFFVLDN